MIDLSASDLLWALCVHEDRLLNPADFVARLLVVMMKWAGLRTEIEAAVASGR